MEQKKYIILVDGVDRTLDIDNYKFIDGMYQIRFKKSKTYTYKKERVALVSNSEIEVNCNKPKADIFGYFKKFAELSATDEPESASSYRKKQYDKMGNINSQSIMSCYIKNGEIKRRDVNQGLIYPFNFNLSQKKATENAFSSNISIIEGPPGTGKTQTILNIIANALMDKKTIAIVSNNNKAISNVQEKLEKRGYDFFTALLGNYNNKEVFFENQKECPDEMYEWKLSGAEQHKLKVKIKKLQDVMTELLELQKNHAILQQENLILEKEKEHFDNYSEKKEFIEIRKLPFYQMSSEKIISFLVRNYMIEDRKEKRNFIKKVEFIFRYGFSNFKELEEKNAEVVLRFQKEYYESKKRANLKEIRWIERKLHSKNFEQIKTECFGCSKRLFEAVLFERYEKDLNKREEFKKESYYKKENFDAFIKEYPVILSSTYSLRNSVKYGYLFDYVIMDEASQIDLVTAGLPLSCAKNVVIVGDLKQLERIVTKGEKKINERLVKEFGVGSEYDHIKQNILSSFNEAFEEKGLPKQMLREHYRCHPKIIQYCNEKYYDGNLIIFTKDNGNDDLPLYLYITAEGDHARTFAGKGGKHNVREIEVINEVLHNRNIVESIDNVGFTAPYRAQIEKAESMLPEEIKKYTVHKYQGREIETMFFSTVLDGSSKCSEAVKFVDDSRLVNVAVSRAIKHLVIMTNTRFLQHGSNIGDLQRYIKYNAGEEFIVQSETVSVFDLLYKDFSHKLLYLKSRMKKIHGYESDSIMNVVIENVLEDDKYNVFKYSHAYELRLLLKDTKKLDDEQRSYVKNGACIDFVIYNKFDKTVVLAVEVDEFENHENNPEQLEIDKKKNEILQKYNTELLRVVTNEGQIEEKLRAKLDEIIARGCDSETQIMA